MKPKSLPALDTISSLFAFDAETGKFTHRAGRRAGKVAGETAGSPPYRRLAIGGTFYYAHRVAWVLITGDDPGEMQIDHINGDRLDNSACNLRLSTNAENCRNSKTPKDNTSGFKGVSWDKSKNRWQAKITINGEQKMLGRFDNPNDAYAAYCSAAKVYHGQFWKAA